MKWKKRHQPLSAAESPDSTTDHERASCDEMREWLQTRAASVDLELRECATRGGISDPANADTIAARLAAVTDLPLTSSDYLGFANVVACGGGDDSPLLGITVTWALADGSEAHAPLGEVIAGIRRLQPELFDLLVEVQRLRNARVDEAADAYLAQARSRGPVDEGSVRALNLAVGRVLTEDTFERYVLDAVVRILENGTTPVG